MSRRVSASSQQLDQNAAFEVSGSPSSSLPKRLPSTLEECATPKSQQTQAHNIMSAKETILRFLLLPKEVLIVLLLEFLNSFRSFGLRFVLYQYVTNEFELGDTQAGAVLGVKGIVDIAFGLIGSILVDIHGVRRISLTAMTVSIVGRTLLAFGRSKGALYSALFFFSPCGDALLSVGLYKVALKKLSTPLTRPLAFALSYASYNLAGAIADLLVDKMRKFKDVNVDSTPLLSGVYTPLRQFVVVTWVVVLVTWLIVYFFLFDWTVIDATDPDDVDEVANRNGPSTEGIQEDGEVQTCKPMVKAHVLRRIFHEQFQSLQATEEDSDNEGASRPLPAYQMTRTKLITRETGHSGLKQFVHQVLELLKLRNTWMVLVFGFCSFAVVMNWTASEMIMPPFLERSFGERTPIYTVQSINLFGCLVMPPIIGIVTASRETFSVMMPGLWLMAISPVFVGLHPTVFGSCLWQIVMTVGECLWSPRQLSWVASLAPNGLEGLFFAIASARSIMGPLADVIMGSLNEVYNPNCLDCRDQYGHFCEVLAEDGQCSTVQESCEGFTLDANMKCPSTCLECPTYVPTNPSTCWYLLTGIGIFTPLSVWFFLPFLRGVHSRDDGFYGIFTCGIRRILGICGASDEHRRKGRKVYGQVEGVESDCGVKRDIVELT